MRFLLSLLSIACWLLATFLVFVLFIGIRETSGYPDAPQRVTLEAAIAMSQSASTPWVWLTDVVADCKRVVPVFEPAGADDRARNVTLAVMRDARGTEVLIEALGRRTCEEIGSEDLFGLLRPLRDAERRAHRKAGLVLEKGTTDWDLCGYCGPSNSKGGLVVVAIAIIASVFLALKLRRWQRQRES